MITRRTLLAATVGSLPSVTGFSAAERKAPKPLKYLQIGTGHGHANKISVYAESSDWEVVGIVEEDPELLHEAKSSSAFSSFKFLSLEEALNLRDIDAVGVETRVRDLLRYARIAIDHGCHVHLDKPAGADLNAYRSLMQTADSKDLVVQMGYMYRFNPAILLLHRMLKAGWLGEIFEAHAVMSKQMSEGDRRELAEFPGGTMFELGCHLIDLTIGVFGRPDRIHSYSRRVLDSEGDNLKDNMLAVFEYPEATATIRSSALEVEGFSRRHLTVCGTEGTFHIQPLDRPSVQLSLSRERGFGGEERKFPKGTSDFPLDSNYRRYVGDAADLAAVIRGEKANDYPSSHDISVQESVLLAAGM